MSLKLSDKLTGIKSYPFHMPGHKRNSDFNLPSCKIDITEIDGFDNLHNPKEVIKELEESISSLYESKKSIISVNGSTCCLLSAICGICKKGDKIIIARNCHKSVYNACLINELQVEYIEPEFDNNFGIYTRVTQESINNAISDNPDAKAIVITSPTYEGITSNITADIPVIIDAAHGSHYGFADYLPKRPDGDIVINSLHKTLPCLTQCAVVNVYNDSLIDGVKKYMDIFETSSPSYILLSSIDKCTDFLQSCTAAFTEYKRLLDAFYCKVRGLENIRIFKNDDITRIILAADGYSGYELADVLRSGGIEPEGVGLDYVILISTVCDTSEGFDLLYTALTHLEKRSSGKKINLSKPIIPTKALEQFEITSATATPLTDAVGRICAESIFAYPPDIPLITAGEIIDISTVNYINTLLDSGVNVISDSDLLPNRILTKSN